MMLAIRGVRARADCVARPAARVLYLAVALALALTLAACGQRGDLYLPTPAKAAVPPVPVDAAPGAQPPSRCPADEACCTTTPCPDPGSPGKPTTSRP